MFKNIFKHTNLSTELDSVSLTRKSLVTNMSIKTCNLDCWACLYQITNMTYRHHAPPLKHESNKSSCRQCPSIYLYFAPPNERNQHDSFSQMYPISCTITHFLLTQHPKFNHPNFFSSHNECYHKSFHFSIEKRETFYRKRL